MRRPCLYSPAGCANGLSFHKRNQPRTTFSKFCYSHWRSSRRVQREDDTTFFPTSLIIQFSHLCRKLCQRGDVLKLDGQAQANRTTPPIQPNGLRDEHHGQLQLEARRKSSSVANDGFSVFVFFTAEIKSLQRAGRRACREDPVSKQPWSYPHARRFDDSLRFPESEPATR